MPLASTQVYKLMNEQRAFETINDTLTQVFSAEISQGGSQWEKAIGTLAKLKAISENKPGASHPELKDIQEALEWFCTNDVRRDIQEAGLNVQEYETALASIARAVDIDRKVDKINDLGWVDRARPVAVNQHIHKP